VERDTSEQKLEYYRQQITASRLALEQHRVRHNELLRLLLEEAARDDDPFKMLHDPMAEK